ncbi:MAG: DUF4091 domain-containing protein [Armatimonadetes bacterium]|nr:DUF4091 domain-containing protein [Armatimonadota bacterium]
MRPPLPYENPPAVPDVALKAITCGNAVASMSALVTSDTPVRAARLVFSDLTCPGGVITSEAISARFVGAVPTTEHGMVCDPLYEVDEFHIDKSAALYITVRVPKGVRPGTYRGEVRLIVGGVEVARNSMEIEVAAVDLPGPHDWSFFLNVWLNPSKVASLHGAAVWSEEHFRFLRPYIEDLAAHGQKAVVVPISYDSCHALAPYSSAIIWKKDGDNYEFDFSVFDRFVELHQELGIDRAIHCHSIVQPGDSDKSTIAYLDVETGQDRRIEMTVGDPEYVKAWGSFFKEFKGHLVRKGWLDKTFIAFDEKPDDVMERLHAFLSEYAPEFKVSLVATTDHGAYEKVDDLSLFIPFEDRGIGEPAPPERSAIGVVQLLDPDNVCAVSKSCPDKTTTTFHVCREPEHPNLFVHSPLVEARMLPFLAVQGGFDGFTGRSYNESACMPTGGLIYPDLNGPVSSLRWEQLREGIQDYELAMIASANIRSGEEMVDYEQAITLACRNVDGRTKSTGDIEIARRLLIPIAEHQMGS